jgi:hypothetical protein
MATDNDTERIYAASPRLVVAAKPMKLGTYCALHGWYCGKSREQDDGYSIRYLSDNSPGWAAKQLFEYNFQIADIEEINLK